ncbi:hypothetical protein JP75_03305 [Devosia riboflavina]|uniref:Transmembrane protein n=1 Tax=Devosia riboflavina TaxID=46914 RepID=A0A087M6T0_9HYPH|nr:hypothetical protein [Devosia riboflavina]KFL32583.1 hypothetical protein JP75_03305 [Devosia riboflavina]
MSGHPDRRFVTVAAISTAFFLSSSFAISWLDESGAVPAHWLWLAAILPIAALLVPLWALWRYLWELDEYLRSIQLKGIYFGLTVLLVLVTGWGYAELYVDAPRLPIFWLNPIYWLAYAAGAMFFSVSGSLQR